MPKVKPIVEKGRVLRKENETKLRAALKSIADILKELRDPDADDEDEDDDDAKESARITEAANVGNWLEARLHQSFTSLADEHYAQGFLTRDERLGLSAAIGAALTTFNQAIESTLPHLYTRAPWAEPVVDADDDAESITEATPVLRSAPVALSEAAIRRDGTARIKIIAPGWGSSGYYPAAVLQRDGPDVFANGTKMYWNHATATEEAQRPEGDLNSLAGELVSNAQWQQDAEGGGLYADAKVFGRYKEAVDELAPYIGVSIRALGKATQGEAEGQKGAIITELTQAKSVDYVTLAGAGGKVVEMFEAARHNAAISRVKEQLQMSIEDKQKLEEAHSQIARLRESILVRDAKDIASTYLHRSGLPEVTQARLLESLTRNVPHDNGVLQADTYRQVVEQAIADEKAYLSEATGWGKQATVRNMGNASAPDTSLDDAHKSMKESFMRLGMTEQDAQQAVNGRAI